MTPAELIEVLRQADAAEVAEVRRLLGLENAIILTGPQPSLHPDHMMGDSYDRFITPRPEAPGARGGVEHAFKFADDSRRDKDKP